MQKILTPLAIVVSGIIIAAAIVFSSGRFSLSDFTKTQKSYEPTTVDVSKNNAPAASASFPSATPNEPIGLGTNPPLGKKSAKVQLVEFGDFQCPYCGQFFNLIEPQLRKDFINKGDVIFAYRDFAFLGPESQDAALATRCASEQGKFWPYHDLLYSRQNGENQGAFKVENLKRFASELKLNQNKFDACLDGKKYTTQVEKDLSFGQNQGVNGTPTLFVDGQLFPNWSNYTLLKSTILSKLSN